VVVVAATVAAVAAAKAKGLRKHTRTGRLGALFAFCQYRSGLSTFTSAKYNATA
jgi:hypothetical protein